MKLLKRLLLGIILLILVFILILVYLLFTTNPKQILSYLSKQIDNAYSLTIEADKVSIDLLKGIELRKVQLIDTAKGGHQPIIYFEEGRILYNPLSLLQKKIDILSVYAGGINASDQDVLKFIERLAQQTNQSTNDVIQIQIGRILIEDATVLFRQVPVQVKMTIDLKDKIELSPIRGKLHSKFGDIEYNGTIQSADVKVNELNLAGLVSKELPLVIHSSEGILKQQSENQFVYIGKSAIFSYSNFNLLSQTEFKLKTDLKKQTIELDNLGLKYNESSCILSKLTYSIPELTLMMQVSNLNLNINQIIPSVNGTAFGRLTIDYRHELMINGELNLSNLSMLWMTNGSGHFMVENNVLDGSARVEIPGSRLTADVHSGDWQKYRFDMDVHSDFLDAEPFIQALSQTNRNAEGPGNLGLNYLLNLKIAIDKIKYQKIETGEAALAVTLNPEGLAINAPSVVDLYRGRLSPVLRQDGGHFKGKFMYTGGKLKDFSEAFFDGGKKLYGTIQADLSFDIPLKDISSSGGSLELEIKNGEVKNFLIQTEISELLYDVPMDDISFDRLTLRGSLKDKMFEAGDLVFESPNINLTGSGLFYITNQSIDFHTKLSIAKDYLSGLPNITKIVTTGYEEGEQVKFNISASGPVKKPRVDLIKN